MTSEIRHIKLSLLFKDVLEMSNCCAIVNRSVPTTHPTFKILTLFKYKICYNLFEFKMYTFKDLINKKPTKK